MVKRRKELYGSLKRKIGAAPKTENSPLYADRPDFGTAPKTDDVYHKENSPLYADRRDFGWAESYDVVVTVGCFDWLHWGHEGLLHRLASRPVLIVGVHSSESVKRLKGTDEVQTTEERVNNLRTFTDDVFVVQDDDPTDELRRFLTARFGTGRIPRACYVRADDKPDFPGEAYVRTVMDVKLVPYFEPISSTAVRQGGKTADLHRLLRKVVHALDAEGVPYYVDCGTLLGMIREGRIMAHDTDVDVSVHLSSWERLKNIEWEAHGLGRKRIFETFPHEDHGNMVSVGEGGKLYCDIYTMPLMPRRCRVFLFGKLYFAPVNPELYLAQLYGASWRRPSRRHASTVFHRNRGLVESAYYSDGSNADPTFQRIEGLLM